MLVRRAFQLCVAASFTAATNLFVSDYSGNISTLELTEHGGHYSLTKTSANAGCAPNPSWLTLDTNHNTLYCLDEGLEVTNGSLTSFTINSSGHLHKIHREQTISGPVSGVIYGNPAEKRSIALAHYSGSALSTWNLDANHTAAFEFQQDILFNLTEPGPNAERQDAPHEHEAVLDPTGNFIVVPDLGADLIRIFSIDAGSGDLVVEKPFAVLPGSGPRHVVFYQPYGVVGTQATTFMFLVSELANTVTSFRVSYPKAGGMGFKQVFETSTYGDLVVPEGNAAAEIAVTPDNRFLIISNRNNTSFHIPSPSSSPHNTTSIPSDSLSTFSLQKDGTLKHIQLWPSGGMFPRHFSLNKFGDLLAVGMQYDRSVVVFERDVALGTVGKPVARWVGGGNVTCVVWEE
ncbi:3-carboxy-cis,cis-mucoante lactonizing enzyme [Aureobasidium pullulans]|uniref:3-carboxy-cis,cis-mucoante lactonizing enzyme n=1 Tax=Aureobasidium pullulans TaxID=5580 RepID=A0A4S9Y1F5_AURPU|nr:3-carboxy-cis,cis-mucoante lactonizing enzyme [Aureobasidium pullulans]